jgi:hypothetical protein
MNVILVDKTGCVPDHEATIELEWVAPQDKDLVKPGAIFYLSLYREISRAGSVRNSEEIRFRRLPSWSKGDLARIQTQAEELLASRFTQSKLDET